MMSLWFQLPAFCEPSLQAITFYDHEIAIPHLELIKNARSSIDLEIYTFTDPMIRNELLDHPSRFEDSRSAPCDSKHENSA